MVDQTGWGMVHATKGSMDLLLFQTANATLFSQDVDTYTPNVHFYKPCERENNNTSVTQFGSGRAGSSVTFRLQDAIDFISCIWTQTTFEPFTKLQNDWDPMHCVNAVPYAQVQRMSIQCGSTEIAAMDDIIAYEMCLLHHGANSLTEEIGDYGNDPDLVAAATKKQAFHAPWLFWFATSMTDALRVCMVGTQGLTAKVYFDSFDKWLVNPNDDTVFSSGTRISAISNMLSTGTFGMVARCHYIGKVERLYYQMNPVIKIVCTWYRYQQTTSNKTSTVELGITFSTRLLLVGVRSANAFDTTKVFTGKVGKKDKFCLSSLTAGNDTITNMQLALHNGKLLASPDLIDPKFYRTISSRGIVSRNGVGHNNGLNFYAIDIQADVFSSNFFTSSANMSRFDKQTFSVTFADTSVSNELFVYSYNIVPMMVELNQWYLPYGTQTISSQYN